MHRLRQVIRLSTLIIGLIAIAVTFAVAMIVLENDIAVAIVTAGATVFVSVFSAVWAKNSEKTQTIEQQIREKKTPIYEKFIGVAFDIIWSRGNELPQEQNAPSRRRQQGESTRVTTPNPVERLQELTPNLIIWGTDEVIASWVEFRKAAVNPNKDNPMEIMLVFEAFMSAIRKDLGHKDDLLEEGDLLAIFINDVDKHLPQGGQKTH